MPKPGKDKKKPLGLRKLAKRVSAFKAGPGRKKPGSQNRKKQL